MFNGSNLSVIPFQGEFIKFLRKSTEEMTQPKLDKYDHFAGLVAVQLRSRPEVADQYMKKILDIIMPTSEN